VALVACLGLIIPGASNAEPRWTPNEKQAAKKAVVKKSKTVRESCPGHVAGLTFYRNRFIEHRLKMGSVQVDFARPKNCTRAAYLANRWETRARMARVQLAKWYVRQAKLARHAVLTERRALYEKWRCIHEHEGRWDDPNAPYWGGLQMSRWFQQTYGPEFYAKWGTADRWPVWAQIEAAERAYQQDGDYGQWPNTARACGLPT
jgi:hypothetical protein